MSNLLANYRQDAFISRAMRPAQHNCEIIKIIVELALNSDMKPDPENTQDAKLSSHET